MSQLKAHALMHAMHYKLISDLNVGIRCRVIIPFLWNKSYKLLYLCTVGVSLDQPRTSDSRPVSEPLLLTNKISKPVICVLIHECHLLCPPCCHVPRIPTSCKKTHTSKTQTGQSTFQEKSFECFEVQRKTYSMWDGALKVHYVILGKNKKDLHWLVFMSQLFLFIVITY